MPEALKSLTVLAQEIERVDKILEQYLGYAGPTEAARAPVEAKALLACGARARAGRGAEARRGGRADRRRRRRREVGGGRATR